MSGNKSKVMRIYNDIVKEAMMFYANSIPSETARTKISIANIGRSMIECYPVLAVSDHSQPWSHFNDKLSQLIPQIGLWHRFLTAYKALVSWHHVNFVTMWEFHQTLLSTQLQNIVIILHSFIGMPLNPYVAIGGGYFTPQTHFLCCCSETA